MYNKNKILHCTLTNSSHPLSVTTGFNNSTVTVKYIAATVNI